jgi:sugar fermentation stimulation protein A
MFRFAEPLEVGKIICRPNRFIMRVEEGRGVLTCHCPTTGKIGNFRLDCLPCLLSRSNDPKRKTTHTVEAISTDHQASWIGINQNAANRYIEHFFRNGQLDQIVSNGHRILREQKIGDSKLDFMIGDTYIEVKTPLMFLPDSNGNCAAPVKERDASYFERFIKHVTELSNRLRNHESAVLIICFIYDAPEFQRPPLTAKNKIIHETVLMAAKSGVKMWQINLQINQYGVELLRCFNVEHTLSHSNTSHYVSRTETEKLKLSPR